MDHLFYVTEVAGHVVGYLSCHHGENGYEIGYGFHPESHHRGYAGEAIGSFLDEMAKIGAYHIVAGTAMANTPSVRLLHRLGFVQTEEERVSFYRDADGNDIVFPGGVFERYGEPVEGIRENAELRRG